MQIQLVSFQTRLNPTKKIELTADIINNSAADFILFPGHVVDTIDDAIDLTARIKNKKVTALFEAASIDFPDLGFSIGNCPFLIQNKKLINLHTHQFFALSNTIENNDTLAESFIKELETRRQFKVQDRNFLLFICGENNILKTLKSEDSKAVIRINDRKVSSRFKSVLQNADIIVNYIHSPQPGHQNILGEKRVYLSKNNRYYFSTNNCDSLSSTAKSIQYAYYNGTTLESPEPVINEDSYMYRLFEI